MCVRRYSARMCAIAVSATSSTPYAGTLQTAMPRLLAAVRSMLSTPTPTLISALSLSNPASVDSPATDDIRHTRAASADLSTGAGMPNHSSVGTCTTVLSPSRARVSI